MSEAGNVNGSLYNFNQKDDKKHGKKSRGKTVISDSMETYRSPSAISVLEKNLQRYHGVINLTPNQGFLDQNGTERPYQEIYEPDFQRDSNHRAANKYQVYPRSINSDVALGIELMIYVVVVTILVSPYIWSLIRKRIAIKTSSCSSCCRPRQPKDKTKDKDGKTPQDFPTDTESIMKEIQVKMIQIQDEASKRRNKTVLTPIPIPKRIRVFKGSQQEQKKQTKLESKDAEENQKRVGMSNARNEPNEPVHQYPKIKRNKSKGNENSVEMIVDNLGSPEIIQVHPKNAGGVVLMESKASEVEVASDSGYSADESRGEDDK